MNDGDELNTAPYRSRVSNRFALEINFSEINYGDSGA